jgi:hypothetical protein
MFSHRSARGAYFATLKRWTIEKPLAFRYAYRQRQAFLLRRRRRESDT